MHLRINDFERRILPISTFITTNFDHFIDQNTFPKKEWLIWGVLFWFRSIFSSIWKWPGQRFMKICIPLHLHLRIKDEIRSYQTLTFGESTFVRLHLIAKTTFTNPKIWIICYKGLKILVLFSFSGLIFIRAVAFKF